jgi:hypothetical protein
LRSIFPSRCPATTILGRDVVGELVLEDCRAGACERVAVGELQALILENGHVDPPGSLRTA